MWESWVGIRAKVINNFQILSIAQITAEALTLAQKIGLDLDTFKEVNAGTTANNGQFHINFLSKVLKNDIEPGFTIDLAHKDMGLAIETANSFRVGLPVGSSCLLYTSPSPRDQLTSRMPSSA